MMRVPENGLNMPVRNSTGKEKQTVLARGRLAYLAQSSNKSNSAESSKKETCQGFEISATALHKWEKRCKQTGSLANKVLNRKHKKIQGAKPLKDVEQYPVDFNYERSQRFTCSAQAIRLALKKVKITHKKRQQSAVQDGKKKGKSIEKK